MEKSISRKFIELAMECQTRHTKETYNQLITLPVTPATVTCIAQLREEYNDFMTDCTALLKAEERILKTPLN